MAYIGRSPQLGVRTRYYYTATGGETSLSGPDDNGATLVFSDGTYVDVMLNGVTLVAGTDYNTGTTNTISGLTALTAADVVEIVVYDVFSVGDAVSKSNGGAFEGAVTFNAGLTANTADINGGTIDGATINDSSIGGTTPAAGAFTTLEATSLDNTPIGGTTPAAGSFTDMAFNSGYGSVATVYGCRAWVNFDGTGTVAIRDSGNVSSITDNGTGDYTVNFTNAMPDANYSTIATTNWRGSGSFDFINMHNSIAATTTSVSFLTGNTSAFLDNSILNIAIFR